MSPRVLAALREQHERTGEFDYVFCNNAGKPLSHHQVTVRIWYPLLRVLGLKKRRPNLTRRDGSAFEALLDDAL